MHLVQVTPGAGGMYCGNCLRDNALVREWRAMGHQVMMVPLYLPIRLDEADQSAGTPIFFGGINVYLQQQSPVFRKLPAWLHRLLDSPKLLKWAAGRAAQTRPDQVGDMALSMLRGEEGNQVHELSNLIAWLKSQPRLDAVFLSNALLAGFIRRLRAELGCPVICMVQGEDGFLDRLPESVRNACWQTLAERVAEADALLSPSDYFAELMTRRLGLPHGRIRVVWNGISLEGYPDPSDTLPPPSTPTLGFFARMCTDKGLDTLVEAYVLLRNRGRVKELKLRIGGSCGPSDEPLVQKLKGRLAEAGWLSDTTFHPNLARDEKLQFLRSLSVFSVPARYGEAFGLYLIEAMAAGVPVVQPRSSAFEELVAATGGGLLCAPENPKSLADELEKLLLDPVLANNLAARGRAAVFEKFSAAAMARGMLRAGLPAVHGLSDEVITTGAVHTPAPESRERLGMGVGS